MQLKHFDELRTFQVCRSVPLDVLDVIIIDVQQKKENVKNAFFLKRVL